MTIADAHFPKVALLLHCNGTNGSTTLTDSSANPKTVTVGGNAQISTAQSRFGGASLLLDGSGDYASVANDANFDAGTGDFTIEMSCYRTGAGTGDRFLMERSNGAGFLLRWSSAGNLQFFIASSSVASATFAFTVNTWYDIAVTRVGTAVNIWVNGTSIASGTSSGSITAAASITIGGYRVGLSDYFQGHIDQVRFTSLQGRYTGTYTPAAAEFPAYYGQISGVVRDSTTTPVQRTVRAYRRDTGALVASTTSDPVTGAYTINSPSDQEMSVLCLDDAAGSVENDLVLRTTPA